MEFVGQVVPVVMEEAEHGFDIVEPGTATNRPAGWSPPDVPGIVEFREMMVMEFRLQALVVVVGGDQFVDGQLVVVTRADVSEVQQDSTPNWLAQRVEQPVQFTPSCVKCCHGRSTGGEVL